MISYVSTLISGRICFEVSFPPQAFNRNGISKIRYFGVRNAKIGKIFWLFQGAVERTVSACVLEGRRGASRPLSGSKEQVSSLLPVNK